VFIVKLGGSLISHKDEYCAPNLPMIQGFAKAVRSRWSELRGRLVLVLGGGSYGHGIARRYHLDDSAGPWHALDLSRTTVGMLEWLALVGDVFREEGIPCYPFQACSYVVCRDGRPERFFVEPVQRALGLDLLPLLAGDLVFDASRRFVIFSSDSIPELFIGELPLRRVVMLTNVPGVASDASGVSQVIRRIDAHNRDAALRAAGGSRQPDVSGGMRTKLASLLRIADAGVEGVICDGRVPDAILPALFDAEPPGTIICARRSQPVEECVQ